MFNYHTHTRFCDGSDEPEKYIETAINKGLSVLGFSAHATVPFDNQWSLKSENEKAYFNRLTDLKLFFNKKPDRKITILNGLEADYIPGVSIDFDYFRTLYKLDYIIGSVHLVKNSDNNGIWFIDGPEDNYHQDLKTIFGGDIINAVTVYYRQIQEMILKEKPDIIGHLDKVKMYNHNIYFKETDIWYEALIEETLTVIKNAGCIVELNTRGKYKGKSDDFFPSAPILKKCLDMGIPIMINSDAHKPDELTLEFDDALRTLKLLGFKKTCVFDETGKKEMALEDFVIC